MAFLLRYDAIVIAPTTPPTPSLRAKGKTGLSGTADEATVWGIFNNVVLDVALHFVKNKYGVLPNNKIMFCRHIKKHLLCEKTLISVMVSIYEVQFTYV